tara:strand:- start:2436 stop:3542 length:1107 start_codon:yes stop_codon:yes gene_type:complete
MARKPINRGSSANDGTGDTLRSAASKINDNFSELYTAFGTSADSLGSPITFDDDGIVFTDDSGHTTKLQFENPISSGRILTLENKSGVIPTIEDLGGGIRVIDLYDSTAMSAAKVYFGNVFSDSSDLPGADSYHGMFAHVHNTGKAYYAHAGNWVTLLDQSTITSGTSNIDVNKSTFKNLNLITPRINSTILDSADNEILGLTTVGTPKNYIQLTAKDSSPTIAAVGDDPDVDLILQAKGTGTITLDGAVNHSTLVLSSTANPLSDKQETVIILNPGSTPQTYTMEAGKFDGEKKIINNSASDYNIISFTSTGPSGGLRHRRLAGAGLPHNVRLYRNTTLEVVWSQDLTSWITTYSGDSVTNIITFTV